MLTLLNWRSELGSSCPCAPSGCKCNTRSVDLSS